MVVRAKKNLPRGRPSIDGVNQVSFRDMVAERLADLRERVGHRYARPRPRQISVLFAILASVLVAVFFTLNFFGTGIPAGKRILGVATQSLDTLSERDLDAGFADLEAVVAEVERSQNDLQAVLQTLPLGIDAAGLTEVSQNLLGAAARAREGLKVFSEARLVWDVEQNSSDRGFFENLRESRSHFVEAESQIEAARSALAAVRSEFLPGGPRRMFESFIAVLDSARRGVGELLDFQAMLLNLLGGEEKTYLLLFQNNNEARASGGFLGTYGVLQFENGGFKIVRIETVYNLDGQLKEKIAAPGPLQRQVTTHWGLRDSNWFVDFPSSARKILDFFEKESGIAADGVIIFTPDLFERLLAISGEIPMPEYGVTLDAENFRDTVQYQTSIAYDRVLNQPKQFLADFAPRLLARLRELDAADWLKATGILRDAIEQRHLMMFAVDRGTQGQIAEFGLSGEILPTEGDFQAIYNSNVGGGKTDVDIRTALDRQVTVLSDGTAIVNLKITRRHEGYEEQYFPRNINFMRVLVPLNSRLLAASGFDEQELLPSYSVDALTDPDLAMWDAAITRDEATGMYVGQEAGYTFFANWQELMPGEEKTVELTYEVALPRPGFYSLLLQKQPGAPPLDFHMSINYLPGEIAYTVPDTFESFERQLELREIIDRDAFYGVVGK